MKCHPYFNTEQNWFTEWMRTLAYYYRQWPHLESALKCIQLVQICLCLIQGFLKLLVVFSLTRHPLSNEICISVRLIKESGPIASEVFSNFLRVWNHAEESSLCFSLHPVFWRYGRPNHNKWKYDCNGYSLNWQ